MLDPEAAWEPESPGGFVTSRWSLVRSSVRACQLRSCAIVKSSEARLPPKAGCDLTHWLARMSLGTGLSASRSAPDAPLATWLQKAADGDQAAFAQVYDHTAARVYGMVLRVLRDPAISEEVTQEVFIDVWTQSGRFDAGRGSAMSWLLMIAHRKAVDGVRRTAASRRRDAQDEERTLRTATDETAAAAESHWQAIAVRDALAKLSGPQRQAIELAYFDGYTQVEVADVLQIPLGTVKTRIRDGLLRLRTIATVTGLELA